MKRIAWLCLIAFSSLVVAQETVGWSLLVSKVSPAVVTIVSSDVMTIAQGSGFLISSDGKIVTNFHVVEGKKNILARLSDGSFLVITGVLATDEANDLVILKADGRNLPFVSLGDSDAVEVGEAICVIGSPMLLEGTVTVGIVSAVRELKDGRKLLQITAPISRGSSGSPVFNRKGEVIGIASFYLAEGQNLNFAIPVNELKGLIRQKAKEPKPLTAVPTFSPHAVTNELEQTFQQALEDAQSKDEDLRSFALRDIAKAMAKADLLGQAYEVAKSIERPLQRLEALAAIVAEMKKAGMMGQ